MSTALGYLSEYNFTTDRDNTTSTTTAVDIDDVKWALSLIKVGLCNLLTIRNNEYMLSTIQEIVEEADCVTVSDMIKEITSVLGVNLSQLSRILGVSRATIYNHMNANDAANSIEDYSELFHLSLLIHNKYSNVSNCLKTVLVDGKTLLRHLEAEYKNTNKILSVIEQIHDKVPNKINKELSVSEQKRLNYIYIGAR